MARIAPMALMALVALVAGLGSVPTQAQAQTLTPTQTLAQAATPATTVAPTASAAVELEVEVASAVEVSVAYAIDTVVKGLVHPWSLAFLPDGRLLLTERAGRLRVLLPDADGRWRLQPEPVSGLPPIHASGQAGLFEVLPDPGFADNGLIYLSYAHGDRSANQLRVLRARLDGSTLQDVQPIFSALPTKRENQHFGGRMAWLPDGTLVVGVGDGNLVRTEAQRLHTHLGKLVRVHSDGRVPADNPFVGRAGALPEIYSLGHRNPQGLVWLADQGMLVAHEHGARGGDELNRIQPGANYGWPLTTDGVDYTYARITPFRSLPGITPPLLHWTPSIAPAGLAYYTGDAFPAWRGSLFVSALVERSVRRVPWRDGAPDPQQSQQTLFTELGERLRDVRAAPDGTLWLLTDSPQGRVLRVRPR